MKTKLFLLLLLGILLISCGPAPEAELRPSPTTAAATAAPTETAVPKPTTEPIPTATETIAPTREPTAEPDVEIDPFTLARQLIKQIVPAAPEGWQVEPCKGEAAVLCISDGQANVGYAELLIYPLSGYDAEHSVRLTAETLPADPATYTAEQKTAVQQALTALAEEHLDVIAADRAITYPDDTFTPLPVEPAQMGGLPALILGFVHTDDSERVIERYVNIATFDRQFIYWFSINYDPANFSTFVSDTAVTQFTPFFLQMAATLPLYNTVVDALPPLPPLTAYAEQMGEIPAGADWSLISELPQGPTAVTVLSQPAQTEPLTAELAAAIAQRYSFDEPLHVEARTGLSISDSAELGFFVAFDGSRTLSLSGPPYSYSDVANWNQGLDLPFAQAAPLADQFLQETGWLTFPYEMAESNQGEGVLFLPVLDGVKLLTPAYGVRVTANGGVSGMSIYPLETLSPLGDYSIITAEMAWSQVSAAGPGTFYRIVPPVGEMAVTALFPTEYSNLPAPGQVAEVYTNIWAYRPLTDDGPPRLQSSDFFRITGDAAMLNDLAEQTDYLVHLWGTVQENGSGLLELALEKWEVVTDAGGLPTFFGTIQQDGGQTFLADEANRTTYLLPNAPADLSSGDYAAVAGLPDAENGKDLLTWQKISVYPPQEDAEPAPTIAPVQTVTIKSVQLVYLPQPAFATGLPHNLFVPAWQFTGTADNGADVAVWITAVSPEFITPPTP